MAESDLKLNKTISDKRAQVQVNALTYDLEWITYKIEKGEIDISPAFQRMFEWDEVKQSRFIESLILNLPIPPIYLVERPDGKLELLDGLQRICSYMHFVGKMPEKGFTELVRKLNIVKIQENLSFNPDETDESEDSLENYEELLNAPLEKLTLKGCDIVPELNDKTVDQLDEIIQRRLQNKPIDMYTYSYNENESWIRYQMFTRMNSGGVSLEPQQIRNAQVRLIDNKFIDFINEVASSQPFKDLASRFFSKRTMILNRGMKLEETVLRFFAFSNYSSEYNKFINPFLDAYLEHVSKKDVSFNYEQQLVTFNKTCELIVQNFSEPKIFRISSKVNFNLFEAVFVTIFQNLDNVSPSQVHNLEECLKTGMASDESFNFKGGGKNTRKNFLERQEIIKRFLGIA